MKRFRIVKMNKEEIINTINKLYTDNYELTRKVIELEAENVILKEKNKKLTQGNKSKKDTINQLQEQIHKIERKMNYNKALETISKF